MRIPALSTSKPDLRWDPPRARERGLHLRFCLKRDESPRTMSLVQTFRLSRSSQDPMVYLDSAGRSPSVCEICGTLLGTPASWEMGLLRPGPRYCVCPGWPSPVSSFAWRMCFLFPEQSLAFMVEDEGTGVGILSKVKQGWPSNLYLFFFFCPELNQLSMDAWVSQWDKKSISDIFTSYKIKIHFILAHCCIV